MPSPSFYRPIASCIAAGAIAGAAVMPALAQTAPSTPDDSTSAAPTETASPQQSTGRDRAIDLWQEHQLSIILAGLLLGGYLGVLWLRPLLLLKVPAQDITVPWTTWKVPLGMVRWLKYRDRVLDTWVEQHWQVARQAFLRLRSVKEREIHIFLPVELDEETISDLTPEHLTPTFQKNTAVLLIWGEGGAGKTSWACQIARWGLDKQLRSHPMIPVLIETELDKEFTLFEAIRGQLDKLTDQPEEIKAELVEKLLQRQRVLVIVDHLSEMGEATRSQIKPQLADFPAKALVVTSRLQEPLGEVPNKTVLQPLKLKVEKQQLWQFVSDYLKAQEKQDLFETQEFSDSCERLIRMTEGRSITVLLVRMYIDERIKERDNPTGEPGSNSVPTLMLRYVRRLNKDEIPNKRDDIDVLRDARIIAWECLRQSFRSAWIKERVAESALAQIEDDFSARDRLEYMEEKLQFLQRDETREKIHIIFDPLAEYLAAIYKVDEICQQPDPTAAWEDFLTRVDQTLEKAEPEIIRGFLLAVRDYCLDQINQDGIPDDLPDRLAYKAGEDPKELKQQQERRRIRRLISQLSVPEEGDRIDAVIKLSQCGSLAQVAELNLVAMLENRSNQSLAVRQAVARALGQLAIGQTALLSRLQDTEEDTRLRRSAAEALGQMGAGRDTLIAILEAADQPLTLCQGAARAIGLIGAPSGDPLPMLVPQLRGGEVITEVKAIRVWQETLPEDLTLALVAVPGGAFAMGSPPEEAGRNVYSRAFPDTEGLDVEAQHRVTIQSFCMSQHPITQAQWRAVAALPAINRELELNPASFKGDVGVASQNENRPIEQVSWYDAVEFCDRLSQHTGKTYRLPSEAEWEYACRAGTSSPFHVGATLSTELANYNGNYTYGTGEKGIYREETTDVGSFGVNGWGLADMHGNVWEWCLDHWHPSYGGAPTDGSAWVTDGDYHYRIMRGGSWHVDPVNCRSAIRFRLTPNSRYTDVGFRVVCLSPWT